MKKIVTMLMASICLLLSFSNSVVFAAKVDTKDIITFDGTNTEMGEETVIDIDPNIQVVITKLPDDYETIETYDLRKTTTTFSFYRSLFGKWRHYDGNHFSVDATSNSTNDGNFTLSLHRYDGDYNAPGVIVAQATIPQNGSFHVEFLNVNRPGTYAFSFQQPLFHWGDQKGNMTIWDWD